VIDISEGFTRVGPLSSPRIDRLVPGQAAFLRSLPSGTLVVFANDEHDPDDFELRRFPPHCMRGTKEAEIRVELLEAARQADARIEIVRKHTFSAFLNTGFERTFQTLDDRSWIVFGCVTDCCVEANVAELIYRGCDVTVVRDLIDTWDLTAEDALALVLSPAHVHDAELINRHWFEHRFPAIWGANVIDSKDVAGLAREATH
jgi:nicotinamidase-related amidase